MTSNSRASLSPGGPWQPRDAWLPRELVTTIATSVKDRFLAEHGGTYFLVVQLDEPAGELAAGLTAATGAGEANGPDGIGFATVQRSPDSVMALLAKRRKMQEQAPEVGEQQVPEEFRSRTCFICPLKKRSQEAFLDRITVGRARNHDIVLRHRSVSKFHGWFECASDGRLFVGDAGSKNRTTVRGTPIESRWEVTPGDPVRFGSVETTLCTPEGLWLALRG